jgi:peptide deformylase
MERDIVTVGSHLEEVLRFKSANVTNLYSENIQTLIDDMIDTVAKKGIGLSAPQVGTPLRIVVINLTGNKHVLVNPNILHKWGTEPVMNESCLSIPGVSADVPRMEHVEVEYRNRRGALRTMKANDLLARVIQHEVDHLDGVLFLERVRDESTIKREGTK